MGVVLRKLFLGCGLWGWAWSVEGKRGLCGDTVDVRSIGLQLLLAPSVSSQVRTWSCRTSEWSEQPFSLG